ncbi:uncharacterized protein LOC111779783 isoform X1 [Cucurbita pepo subsp. pepo]|uniref:uncharacterized protein LOC111779783 isoform X1 n=1 Tax=Cucurbita pepo subsp. pepo TaxID=3664 RepID=UPI000C9D3997|nr:uncharacterized protein LOC111779783 isoform X1 [Cucurbita pepo subsp. pepo]XP_023515702.1 uncharacterized protein LOC111779783 isoform X2 [Cucurbita pepo subsp. pepo]XP_023515711.1 uncharacterized protein LOC111779783 isoform X1 [Cucurbita pepo subsp. pepo]
MESAGSSKMINPKKIRFNGLIDQLFSLTLEDISYDDFYKDKVQNIPESFKSVHQYLASYLFPLLEETRAELSSSLKAIHRAPFAKLISVEERKSSGKLLLNVNVDTWRNTTNNSKKEPYRTLPGDIFLILDDKPENVMNLQCSTRTWAFAWVQNVTDNGCSTHLKLNVSKNISGEQGMSKEFFIVFLMNVTTNVRIWNCLHFSEDVKIIKHVLSKNSMGDEICNKCSLSNNVVCAEKLGASLSSVLNDSQKEAVLCCVCKTLCDHKPSVELIWGPPGTGKTKTISFLLWSILEMKQRVLACAPTNVAITELASRVVKLLRESSKEGGVLCSLGDVLIFGNKDRLKVSSELEEIYLDYRVGRLLECFGQSGWKCHITSLIKLLESSNSEYQSFLESNVNTSRSDKKKGDNGVEVSSFLGFIREKFKTTALAVRGCLQTLITHIPKQFILEHNFQNIEILLNLVDSFGTLLSQDNVTSEQMEILFSCSEVFMRFPNYSMEATFLHLRSQCLSILRFLQASLDQLQLPSTPNEKSVKQFCFQRASLILCTASSSFQLKSMKMDPVNLLIIDEAAQLKECESIVPLQLPGLKHAILIGDERQLPAVVSSQVCDAAGYGRSLFERLSLLGHSKHLLNTQYRMHPSISCFPNSKFYSNQILDAPLVKDKVHKKRYISSPMFGPYTFLNVSVGKEEGDDDGHSKKNTVEVAVVIKIIEKLYKAWRKAKTRLNVGVISFYAAQVSAIQSRLGHKYEKSGNFTVKVKSVDDFQGGEEDVIILTTVRSNRRSNIGFISNSQRINVALTRARHCLWIVGDATTLGNSNSEWESVVSNAKDRQCYFNAEEDKDLADAIIGVKKVLLELDDLLNKDSVLFKLVQWKVLLSDSFRASFQKVVSINQKKSIIVLLLRLACGWRPEANSVSNTKCSNIISVKVEGLFIVYSLDIEKDSKYKQVLKIWDIKPLADVKVLVECLSNIHELYTDDFLNLCKAKSHKGDLELPITWSASLDVVMYKDHMKAELDAILSLQADSDDIKNSTLKKNLLQMKFQSLSYLKAKHLLSRHDSKELDLPCQVEDEQLEIILFPTSAFIMGRPDSGKTAALTIKLFMREQQQQIHSGGCSQVTRENAEVGYRNDDGEACKKIDRTVLRQLFITATLKQCQAVKEHLSYLKRISTGGNILEENQKFNKVGVMDMDDAQDLLDVPNSFDGIPFSSYPLVITFRKFLIMVDRTVGDSFLVRFLKQWKLSCGKPRDPLSTAAYNFIESKEVTVKKFASSYWSYFDGCLTNNLDAVMVFNEIISQIKGGLGAKETPDGRLSKLDYTRLAKGRSTLSWKQRERIYDIFLDYERMKNEKGEYDLADLVIDLHHRLKCSQYTGDQMDYVYVDEVQALTMMEIALLKYLCGNVSSGFVFSSNTAQTIAKGIDFRFHDIRFLFYKEFISRVKTDEKDIGAGLLKIPDILHMNQNCHTQPKILQLASSVTDLLFRFFPHCIDILCPETSEMSSGNFETPVLLENGKGQNMMTLLFGGTGNIPADTREFGAKQVILVRDEHARDGISNLVRNQAIVLTIMECQSLEFQDVLLYNFFNSSPLGHQWSVIYQYMIEQDMLEIAPNSPNFNQPVHMDLCWELKLLHIAITRSRQRLWIYEDSQEFPNPIVDYWKKLCYIQVKTLDYSIIQTMKAPSTKEEWSSLGLEFFCEGVYVAASLCFERADDRLRRAWARAASLRATACILDGSNPQMARNALQEAAEIYISMDRAEVAAKCFIELKEYQTAAYIYSKKCGEAKLEDAGDCYMLAECYELAAEAYSRGRFFLKFLNVCTVANLFDMGLQVVCSWRKHCDDDDDLIEKCLDFKEIWHVFLQKGALHYHQLQDFRSILKFVDIFDSMDEKCSFLRTLGLSEKILLLEKDVEEDTNIIMKKEGTLLEIHRLEKAGNLKDASSLILQHVLFSSLWGCSKKGWPLQLFKRKEKLLTRAKILAMNESDSFYDYVTTEANILSNQTRTLFEMEQNWSSSHRHGNLRGEILSAWRILDAHLSSGTSKYIWENKIVTSLREHVEQTISRNRVSVQTLVYFWNFWKENVMSILEYLQLPESQINSDYASYEQFCLDYLGVRKQLNYGNSIYHLVDPEAEWARTVSFEGNENFVTINSREFVAAAQSYWLSEISSVGLKILSKLKNLHMLSVNSSLSFYFQAFTAVHLFQMAKFLTEDDYIKSSIDYKNQTTIFDSGYLSIQFLRLHQTPNVDLANEIEAVHDNSQHYLVSCALHFHKIQDSITMLKFVRDFYSMDSKRSFLKSFNYFNELLSLEMEAGNFSEALAIAVSQGNLLLEIDLLEKTGNYKEASLLLFFYIYANSLWTSRSKGWPLKEFKHKQKLLEKTMSIAKRDSESFYDMISVEANILSGKVSGLDEMEQSLTASKGHKNFRGLILSVWKILDAHLKLDVSNYMWENVTEDDLEMHSKESISKNQVSFGTLVYFWNLWKDSVNAILDHLCSIDIEDVHGYCESQQDFCLFHFGVRRQYSNHETLYFLLNPDADWATEVVNGSLHRNGGLIGIAACQFTSAGWRYWSSEVLSVGIKVLEKLKTLYSFSATASNASELCQSMIAINFCEVENFLKNSQFLKFATGTLLQNFTSVRLQFVLCCKDHLGQGSLVGNIHDLEDLKFTFLRKCALHYHRLQDTRTMMKFVKTFHSMDSKRLFLKSVACFDELISLEVVSGNFMEAAVIARQKGDLLLEVDLLEKAGQLEEAVELILFYVLANSLWTTQSKGWPLKQFKQKEKLLSKAKSIAKLNSDVFHRNVCLETDILSDGIYSLLDIKHHLSSSGENKNICGEILSARRILDAHLCSNTSSYDLEDVIVSDPLRHAEDKISQSQVSIETLSHFWNLWKDHILGVIKYLESLGTKNVDDFIIYEGFCLKYLGVRKQFDDQNTYQLFTDADWMMHISHHSVQRDGKLMSMDVQQFALAARSYWNTELLSIGMKVLECLSNSYRFSVIHSLSRFRRSSIAIGVFEIANFLLSYNLAKLPDDDKKLHDYLESYADHFFDNVFGLCWTEPMTENMITLRETELSCSVTEAVILKIIGSKSQLSYEQIGKVVMALLGSGKLTSGVYDKIAGKCSMKLQWKAVIDAFNSQTSESSVAGKVVEASGEGGLINQLHEALMLTFVNWKKEFDYMSPDCFLYIVERQFVLISMSQGCFYTTRSSFIEWLVCEEWSGRHGQSMVSTEISSEPLFDSIAKMVHELLFNNCGAREWIKRSNINSKEYYPIFLLRLVIIMCLLSANLGKYYNMLYDFIGKPDMHSLLPEAFSKLFMQRKKQNLHFLNYMAEAAWKIRNPLVKVCFKGVCNKPVAPAAISLRMKKIGKKDDIWKLLFAKNLMDDHNCGSISPSGRKKAEPINGSTLLNAEPSQVLHNANEDENRDAVEIMIKTNSNTISDSIKSEKHTQVVNPKSRKSNALKKMKLKKRVHCINTSVPKSSQKGSFDRETELFRVKSILDELKMSPAVRMSDPKLVTSIERLSRKLERGKREKNTWNMDGNTSQSAKLSSASRRERARERKGKESDKMSVENKMLTAKGSSQVLNFQPKIELETTSHTKTKDKKIIAQGSSQVLQFQPKLKTVYKETTSQNGMKTEDMMKVAHVMSPAKGSSPGLKFQPNLESVRKEPTSQNDPKTKDEMKVADHMLTAKGASQGLKFQPKLESVRKEPTSQSDTKTKDKMKVADNMSTAKGSSQGLQFQPKNEAVCKKKASQNEKTGDKMKVAHVHGMPTAKGSSNKLQFKPKVVSAKKEIATQNDVKTEKDTKNVVNKAESGQKLQGKQNLRYVQKETTCLSDSKVKKEDKMKLFNNLSEAKESSQPLQLEQKKLKQKDIKAEKGK